jgi:D-alanyl-D-alanine carboxypeptidase
MQRSKLHAPHTALALVLTLTGLHAGCGEDDTAPAPDLDARAIAEIQALADKAVAAGIPGVVVHIQAGNQTVAFARGVEDLTTRVPLTVDHHFRVGSMAKSLLASVVLQLVDEGKVRLDDTIESQLPGMVAGNSFATIEQVLRLQSGLFDHAADERYLAPYLAGDFGHVYTPEQLLALSNDHPPVFPPGERFMYSNTNYVVIGLLIQKLTGLPLGEAVAQRIMSPLRMSASSMPLGTQVDSPFAHGYLFGAAEQQDPIDVTGISASSTFGHGNLVATARDLSTFYAALVAGRVVAPARLPAMFTPDARIDTRYGIGVFSWPDFPCGAWIGHDGSTAGFDAVSYARRDGRRQITVLANSLTFDDKVGDETAQAAWKALIVAAACK